MREGGGYIRDAKRTEVNACKRQTKCLVMTTTGFMFTDDMRGGEGGRSDGELLSDTTHTVMVHFELTQGYDKTNSVGCLIQTKERLMYTFLQQYADKHCLSKILFDCFVSFVCK